MRYSVNLYVDKKKSKLITKSSHGCNTLKEAREFIAKYSLPILSDGEEDEELFKDRIYHLIDASDSSILQECPILVYYDIVKKRKHRKMFVERHNYILMIIDASIYEPNISDTIMVIPANNSAIKYTELNYDYFDYNGYLVGRQKPSNLSIFNLVDQIEMKGDIDNAGE